MGYQAKDLKPDFEFENLFPTDDPDIAFYEQHLQHFGYDNDFITVILPHDPLFDSVFLNEVQNLSEELRIIPGVNQVQTPTELMQPLKGPMGTIYIPVLHLDESEKLASDSIRIFEHPFFSSFFGQDRKSLMLNITHEHFTQPEDGDTLVARINNALIAQNLSARLVGKLTAQKTFIEYIGKDFGKFIVLGLIISMVILLVIFRSFRSALLPYLISLSALICLLGGVAMMGLKLSILSSLIPPIILFASTSDAIHLINAYQRSSGATLTEKLSSSLKHVFIPTLLTSVTTAVGFFSLYTIGTKPVQEFGIIAGCGVMIAFFITMIIGPVLLYGWKSKPRHVVNYRKFTVWLLTYPKAFRLITIVLLGLAWWGFMDLKTDAYLLGDLPEQNNTRQGFQYLEDQYGGYKPWEIAIWTTNENSSIWEEVVARELNKIQNYLTSTYGLKRDISPITMLKLGNQMISGGQPTAFEMPSPEKYDRAVRAVKPLISRDATVLGTMASTEDYARIIGFIPEWGSKQTIEKNEELQNYLARHIDPSVIQYRITGTTYLIDKSHHELSRNLIKGLWIAVLTVSLILGLYFKSIKLVLISLVPNIIPLFLIAGIMGWFGIDLQLTTSIIFAASFGIAVDDTIHFIATYPAQRSRNKVFKLIKTFELAGNAIITTSLILIAGFSLFLISSFGATFYLGLFLLLSLSLAVIIDMTLLPLILNHFNKTDQNQFKTP